MTAEAAFIYLDPSYCGNSGKMCQARGRISLIYVTEQAEYVFISAEAVLHRNTQPALLETPNIYLFPRNSSVCTA